MIQRQRASSTSPCFQDNRPIKTISGLDCNAAGIPNPVLGAAGWAGPARGGRRTRDGCTPFVRELQLATWLGAPHPDISRWQRYRLSGDWANLLSLHSAEVLTVKLVGRILAVFATFPTWRQDQVYHYLRQQGVPMTATQVAHKPPSKAAGSGCATPSTSAMR